MKKCLVWGAANEYNNNINKLNFEVLKGNISVLAIISRDKYATYIDGKKLINKEDIVDYEYDYIIVFNELRFDSIVKEASSLGIDRNKFINGKVFNIPCFDFERYTYLLENKITIISDDCWAANVYHYLGFEFFSPFILLFFTDKDYIKLLENLDYYLNQPLCMESESNIPTNSYPIGSLGNNEQKIYIKFNHYISFEDAKLAWDRRLSRMNKNNLFIKMTITNDDIANGFDNVLLTNKVGFYYKKYNGESIKYCPRYSWKLLNQTNKASWDFGSYIRNVNNTSMACDLLKMLCGEQDFMREY